MAVFPGPREWSRARRVRRDVAVTWGFPEPSAGLPRPSLLFDGRRKKRLRLWREGRKRRDDDGGNDEKGFLLEFARKGENASSLVGFFLRGEHRLFVSASVPVRLSLGGSKKKTGFGECRSSVVKC